jgi:hypothetical protein
MRLITISAAILLGSALSAANAQQLGASNTPAKGPLQKGLNGRGLGNMIVAGGSDTCGTATAISGPGPFAGDNLGANTDGPAACGAIGADVWYNWTANSTGSTIASLCGSGTNYDSVLQIFDTAACTGASLGCNDDFCGLVSQVTFNAVNGNVYKVRVGGFASSTGSYSLTFSAPPPPPTNDECASPLPAVTGVNAFNNTAATTSAQGQAEGACLFFGSMAIDHDTWWTWTAPGTGTATVQLCGQTTVDSKVSAFDGTAAPRARPWRATTTSAACSRRSPSPSRTAAPTRSSSGPSPAPRAAVARSRSPSAVRRRPRARATSCTTARPRTRSA